jgi:prepilin-type N-terminal cleavage/methylation domain-containing protein
MNPIQRGHQAGYSLAEMLTVVAIIGILSLVMVPNFVGFYQSNKMKASMRSFTSDLRGARALSITQGRQTLVTFGLGKTARQYDIWIGDKSFNSQNWTPVTGPNANPPKGTKKLNDIVYFPAVSGTNQTFTDVLDCSSGTNCVAGADQKLDVIFFPDGHAQLPTGVTFNGQPAGTITIQTDLTKIPKPQYSITISPSGQVHAQ